MPRIHYVSWEPRGSAAVLVEQAADILDEYADEGFRLSLRQLYYQFVARDLLPNEQKSYKRLGDIVQRARDAGLIDWEHIEDRGRTPYARPHYENGTDFLERMAPRFGLDLWEGQRIRVQVWVEKDALSDIIGRAASRWDCTYFACKGYVSASAMWHAAHEMLHHSCDHWAILHLGDHDPSGIDMSRDIQERLERYVSRYSEEQKPTRVVVYRIALTMDQVRKYGPPPNPAKITDTRAGQYMERFGDSSWELDALEPSVLDELVETNILRFLDQDLYSERYDLQESIRSQLESLVI